MAVNPARILLVDHRDSFTYNLVHLLRGVGAVVRVLDSRAVTAEDLRGVTAVLLGPGPHGPEDVPESHELARVSARRGLPLLGVCLGLQVLGAAFGSGVRRATCTAHGVVSTIRHDGTGLFDRLENPARFVRYHSLVLRRPPGPEWDVTARDEDGDVAAVAHRNLPLWGVQFHPESICSEGGAALMKNFLRMAGRGGAA